MRKAVKIGILGTHGVGKTTFLYRLATELKLLGYNVQTVAEVASTSPLPINETADPDSQLWILLTQAKRELETSYRTDFLICDRTVADTLAYYERALLGGQPSSIYPATVIRFGSHWTRTYDHLIYVKRDPNLGLVDDGIRSLNLDFQLDIESRIDDFLECYLEIHPEARERLTEVSADAIFCDESIFQLTETLEKLYKERQKVSNDGN